MHFTGPRRGAAFVAETRQTEKYITGQTVGMIVHAIAGKGHCSNRTASSPDTHLTLSILVHGEVDESWIKEN
jgi:hypothetical protein